MDLPAGLTDVRDAPYDGNAPYGSEVAGDLARLAFAAQDALDANGWGTADRTIHVMDPSEHAALRSALGQAASRAGLKPAPGLAAATPSGWSVAYADEERAVIVNGPTGLPAPSPVNVLRASR